MKKNKMTLLNIMEQLPSELHYNILARLPAYNVIQCKLVCKTWKKVVEDPDFPKMHTRRLLMESDQGNSTCAPASSSKRVLAFYVQNVVVNQDTGACTAHGQCVEYNDDDNAGTNRGIKVHKRHTDVRGPHRVLMASKDNKSKFGSGRQRYATIVGSSNGLICVYSSAFQVFNPFTKEHALLPLIRPPRFIAYGFGYCPSTKEYKVACILHGSRLSKTGLIQVYTLGSGTWRSKGEITHSTYLNSSRGVFMNGAIYWMADDMEIVCFNLESEEIRVIQSPILPSPRPAFVISSLVALGGCLCAVFVDKETNVMEIWEMDKNACWTEKISWPSLTCEDEAFALTESGKILLQNWQGIISFDPKNGSSTYIYNPQEFQSRREFIPYVASFVSLEALGEEVVVEGQGAVEEEAVPTTTSNHKFLKYLAGLKEAHRLKHCKSNTLLRQ